MKLKDIRLQKKISQNIASEICGVSLRTYKRLENEDKYLNTPKYNYCLEKLTTYESSKKELINRKNITVVGAGYVGLSAAVLLSKHHQVEILDINEDKIKIINSGHCPFLDKDIEKELKEGHLKLHASIVDKNAYKKRDYIIIALPTDLDEESGSFDVSAIKNTIKEIREVNKRVTIVIKSTVSIGFTDSLNDNNIIFSPEFLKEGSALYDNFYPSRIIIGANEINAKTKQLAHILAANTKNNAPILYMKAKEAEAVKLFANAYLAMRVSFFNELDSFMLSEDMDAKNVIPGVSLDPRIGDFYNNPSYGYGGYCLPKDTTALSNLLSTKNNSELITSISKSNNSRKEYIASEILQYVSNKFHKPIKDINIGVYSCPSKMGSDNSRHASIRGVINVLTNKGVNVLMFDKNKDDINSFYDRCDLIIANRIKDVPEQFLNKIYSRDIFYNN